MKDLGFFIMSCWPRGFAGEQKKPWERGYSEHRLCEGPLSQPKEEQSNRQGTVAPWSGPHNTAQFQEKAENLPLG
jgi:hypothetical protein